MEPKILDSFSQIRVEISVEIGAGATTCYTFSCGPLTCHKFESENHSHLELRRVRIWKYELLALAFENHSLTQMRFIRITRQSGTLPVCLRCSILRSALPAYVTNYTELVSQCKPLTVKFSCDIRTRTRSFICNG